MVGHARVDMARLGSGNVYRHHRGNSQKVEDAIIATRQMIWQILPCQKMDVLSGALTASVDGAMRWAIRSSWRG